MRGSILIISGPSGSGKSSLCKILLEEIPNVYFSVSTTTRNKREGEMEGVHYHYVSKQEFEHEIVNDGFLEWAKVHDNYYGTSRKKVEEVLSKGKLVVFDIDVQGFQNVKKIYGPISTSVFITTPTRSELITRLTNRGSEAQQVIDRRIRHAVEEMKYMCQYDYTIINDRFEPSSQYLLSVARSAMIKTTKCELDNFINVWKDS